MVRSISATSFGSVLARCSSPIVISPSSNAPSDPEKSKPLGRRRRSRRGQRLELRVLGRKHEALLVARDLDVVPAAARLRGGSSPKDRATAPAFPGRDRARPPWTWRRRRRAARRGCRRWPCGPAAGPVARSARPWPRGWRRRAAGDADSWVAVSCAGVGGSSTSEPPSTPPSGGARFRHTGRADFAITPLPRTIDRRRWLGLVEQGAHRGVDLVGLPAAVATRPWDHAASRPRR